MNWISAARPGVNIACPAAELGRWPQRQHKSDREQQYHQRSMLEFDQGHIDDVCHGAEEVVVHLSLHLQG